MRAPSQLEYFRILREQLVEAFIKGDDDTFVSLRAELDALLQPLRAQQKVRNPPKYLFGKAWHQVHGN